MKVYTTFCWLDLFLHGMFCSYAVLVVLHLIQDIIIKEKETTEKRFTLHRMPTASFLIFRPEKGLHDFGILANFQLGFYFYDIYCEIYIMYF